jgi:hypothetical protein
MLTLLSRPLTIIDFFRTDDLIGSFRRRSNLIPLAQQRLPFLCSAVRAHGYLDGRPGHHRRIGGAYVCGGGYGS